MVGEVGADEKHNRLECLEVKSHRFVDDPAEDYEEGGNEKGNLHATADGYSNGKIHLQIVSMYY